MERFKNILVPIDSKAKQQPALKRAATLAQHNDAELKVVDVIEILPAYVEALSHVSGKIRNELVSAKKEQLEAIIAPLKDQGLRVTSEVLQGRPFRRIIQQVLKNDHDLVLKAVGSEEISNVFFGSTDLRLLRKCPCVVWLVKPTDSKPFERILAAIDPVTKTDPEDLALNRKIMELAISLSQSEGSELHLAHAWRPFGESVLRSRLEPDELAQYVEKTRSKVSEMLDQFLAGFGGKFSPEHLHLLKGEYADVILNLVKEADIDLIVMGTVTRTGLSGLLIGNTAEKILTQVECSVLTVKPDGFVSPVEAYD